MKKKILIPIILVLVVAILGTTGVLLFGWLKNQPSDGEDMNADEMMSDNIEFLAMFRCDTITDLQKKAQEANITLSQFENGKYWGLDQCSVGPLQVSMAVGYKEDAVTMMSGRIEFPTDYSTLEDKVDRMAADLSYSNYYASVLFDVNTTDHFKVYHVDGHLLDGDMEQAYESVANNQAQALLVVKESDKSYWRVSGFLEEERYVLYFDKVFDNLEDTFADIILE